MHKHIQVWFTILLTLFVCSIATIWQLQGRTEQNIALGSPADDGVTAYFQAPEKSPAGATYRWSQPEADLFLQPIAPQIPVVLALQMYAPPQPDGPQSVVLTIDQQRLPAIGLSIQPRIYHILSYSTTADELNIHFSSKPLQFKDDPRHLGIILVQATLTQVGAFTSAELLHEIWLAPFLPISLLLLLLAGRLLGLSWPISSIGSAGLFGLCLLLDHFIPDLRLRIATLASAIAIVSLVAIAGFRLLQRIPVLLPTTDRRARFWLVGLFSIMLFFTFTPSIKSDGMRYYAYLRSFALDHDLQFADEYNALDPNGFQVGEVPQTLTNHTPNNASIGPAIAWAPLFVIAHIAALNGPMLGLPWQADGYSEPYIVLVAFSSALAGLATMFGCYAIIRRWVTPAIATITVITIVLGSNLLYYLMREGSFAHSISATCATFLVLAWLRLEEHPSLRRWAMLGIAAGTVALTYWVGALTFLLLGLTFCRLLLQAWQQPVPARQQQLLQLIGGAALAGGLILILFLPQMLAWWVIYGSPLVIPHGNDYVRPQFPHLMPLLFSQLYGLLPWTPAFFAGMLGLLLLWKHSRWQMACLLLAGGLYLIYNASLARWFAGGSFGLRRLTLLTPWFVIGLALLFQQLARLKAGLPAQLSALMIAWTTLLLVRYDLYLIPHSPEAIQQLSPISFYLSRETLPVWGVLSWLLHGFLVQPIYGFSSPAAASGYSLLALVMVIAIAVTLLLFRQIEQRLSKG